jgi:Rrf2 family cysteine metabolism transcriptional repressor
MKISTKGRYGLRALLDLAVHSREDSVTLANIAERQEISVGYLEQIFSALRKANIVIGTKGPQGGYVLAHPPEKLPVQTVLDVLEGDLFSVSEDSVESSEASLAQQAVRRQVWNRITGAASNALKGVTLADLMDEFEKGRSGDNLVYYI